MQKLEIFKKNYEGLTQKILQTQENIKKFQDHAISKIQTQIAKSESTLNNFKDNIEKL